MPIKPRVPFIEQPDVLAINNIEEFGPPNAKDNPYGTLRAQRLLSLGLLDPNGKLTELAFAARALYYKRKDEGKINRLKDGPGV